MLVVQGGPGTGKTVVALHRAAYLLYTHRFPLEDQGVLVIGPNRVFLRYIEQVLPSLGEAGVEQVVLADLVPGVTFAASRRRTTDSPLTERVKGDARMSDVIDKAVADRERPLRDDLVVPFRSGYVRLRAEETARIVAKAGAGSAGTTAARGSSRARSGRRWPRRGATATRPRARSRAAVRTLPEVRAGARTDVAGAHPGRTAARPVRLEGAAAARRRGRAGRARSTRRCYRPRSETVDDVRWTPADVALLDDARDVLGPKPGRNGKIDESDEIRTYGHIVIDEVQDLTPMQLKMATRRSLNGSMTIVGDIAQATGPLAPDRLGRRARSTCPIASRRG